VRHIPLFVSLCALSACKSNSPEPEPVSKSEVASTEDVPVERKRSTEPAVPKGPRIEVANETEPCQRTLCIAGPTEPREPNIDLAELCRLAPGIVRRCEGKTCKSAWSLDDWKAGLDALITSLDRDASGKVDASDPMCTINVAGWSTGAAILAGPMIEALAADARMTPERAKVERMVLVAPWQAGAGPTLRIPDAVRNAWIYRNTAAPADDCSRKWEGGPWISPKPECGPQTQCWDYDYSFEPALAFVSRRGSRSGAAIGHCNMMAVVAKIAPDNLERGTEALEEHVPRFSDGRRAGRPHTKEDRH
jgi:hypothetical protein